MACSAAYHFKSSKCLIKFIDWVEGNPMIQKGLVCRDAKMPVSTQRDGKFEISTQYKRSDSFSKNYI